MGYEVKSSLAFLKYPTLRDHPRHTGDLWLQGKRIDDNIGELWRVHDNLYNFDDFIKAHPGGEDWLTLTKGTDITEAFEAHHISTYPETLLKKYFVRKATSPRNSPFTFHEDGFYKTLKKRIREVIKDVPKTPSRTSALYADGTLIAYVLLAILAANTGSFLIAILSGMALCSCTIIGHNYFHQKDNFRMYYFDLSFMSSRQWRITHALSHHIFTNTIYDYEISFVEPFLQYLPIDKPVVVRYLSWFYSPFVFAATFPAAYVRMLLQVYEDGWHTFRKESLLPFTIPILMYLSSSSSIVEVVILFAVIIVAGSLNFSLIGINAAHHAPEIFHDGDLPRSKTLDWGLHELDTVVGRHDIDWSHFLVISNFGDHCMHHLFPTLDHGVLKYLRPVAIDVCKQFDAEMRSSTQMALVKGQYLQLARVSPIGHEKRYRKSKVNKRG